MAGDLMGTADFAPYMSRLIKAPIDFQVGLPYRALAVLAGGDSIWATLSRRSGCASVTPCTSTGAASRCRRTVIPDVLSANGQTGPEEASMSVAVLRALLQTAALLPADARSAAVQRVAGLASDAAVRRRAPALLDRPRRRAPWLVERIPSHGPTAEGQFAFRPDTSRSWLRSPAGRRGYQSHYTVLIRNGNGDAGIGELVVQRLAMLDVNLPTPGNAPSFDYSETQILAGSEALGVAEDIRAILGHGVVLAGGDKVPPATVVVIVGKDLRTKDLR